MLKYFITKNEKCQCFQQNLRKKLKNNKKIKNLNQRIEYILKNDENLLKFNFLYDIKIQRQ